MTALNNALANCPSSGFVYPEQRPLQTMRHWPGIENLMVEGDEIMAAAVLDEGTIFWCARPCRHHHVIAAKWRTDEAGFHAGAIEGFLTRNGRFLDREQAYDLVHPGPGTGKLSTEDLW